MSFEPAAISVEGVSKRYRLGTSLPGLVGRLRLRRGPSGQVGQDLWALRDVSFSVGAGEVLGIIGANGAGKTTALKLLAGVTRPTHGTIKLNGRVSALIELGAGFHPELTGRDNIYLNGAILGMKRREIDRVLDEIVAFAELEEFIDTPVKRYSSGMYARLGFSVAVHVDPDILLVDEVLSVGDLAFQQKSLSRMLDFKEQAKAMIFVSHNMLSVQRVCNRVLWLDHGQTMMVGRPDEVVESYRRHSAEGSMSEARNGMDEEGALGRITQVELLNSQEDVCDIFSVGDVQRIRLSFCISQPLTNPVFGVAFYHSTGQKLGEASNLFDDAIFDQLSGEGQVMFTLPQLPLAPGTYYINLALSEGLLVQHHHISYAARFHVCGTERQNLQPGPLHLTGVWECNPLPSSMILDGGDCDV